MIRPTLSGKAVDLEPLSSTRVSEEYAAWFNDPIVTKYNSHGEELMTVQKVAEYVARVERSDTDAVFALIAKDKNIHIGNIALQKIDRRNQQAEYAIILGNKDYWGKGIAKEASELLLRYGFGELGLHRIYCGTSVKNEPMQQLALRLGFTQEGVRKEAMLKRGEFVDMIEYGLLKKTYE